MHVWLSEKRKDECKTSVWVKLFDLLVFCTIPNNTLIHCMCKHFTANISANYCSLFPHTKTTVKDDSDGMYSMKCHYLSTNHHLCMASLDLESVSIIPGLELLRVLVQFVNASINVQQRCQH